MAQKLHLTPAQVALAWLINRKPFIVPIPATTNSLRLMQNTLAGDVVLSPEAMQELEALTSSVTISGDRYDEKGLKIVNR